MATKESRRQRGRRRGLDLAAHVLAELRTRRVQADVSQTAMARQLQCSQSSVWRREANTAGATVVELSEMAAILGLELSIGIHEVGDPLRDKGHQALAARFAKLLAPRWQVTSETPLPTPGDRRAWDKLLRLVGDPQRCLVGVELETRVRDIQAVARRMHLRERDGGVDVILLALSNSTTNRRLVNELRTTLGPQFGTSPRVFLRALREGSRPPGSGVVLV